MKLIRLVPKGASGAESNGTCGCQEHGHDGHGEGVSCGCGGQGHEQGKGCSCGGHGHSHG